MTDLSDIDRLKVWAAAGVKVTLKPDDLRFLARLFEDAEAAELRVSQNLEKARRDYKIALWYFGVGFVLFSITLAQTVWEWMQ